LSRFQPKLKEKRWDPKKEESLIEIWEREGLYRFKRNSKKPIFSIDTPPPYASGTPHIGFAVHYSQIDMIARYMRMQGFEVLFPMGIDRNGLPVEVQVERLYKIRMYETPREKFLELCRELLDRYEREILEISKRLGFSMNSFDPKEIYRTDSPEYRRITQATFIELFKRGLIYEDERPNNWCPRCRTTLADAEVEYQEEETRLVYIKFRVKETGEDLIIATTRPELLAGCAAVLVHPDDDRYKHLHNKHAIVPIYEKVVPIIAHKEANPEFGTGVMMLCSFGDYTDIRLFRELRLEPVKVITEDGTLSEAAGKYRGLSVKDARNKIIEDLKKKGLLVKEERITHKIPVCWRCKTPIEFIVMKEWYLKQLDFIDNLKDISNKMRFFPPENKRILDNWLNSVTTDWPISRRRYYGTEIPLWYCENCGNIIIPEPGKYYVPWRDPPPINKCPKCGSTKFKGETRTFDTWFDSSISPLYISGYLRDEDFFKEVFPVSLRPQGKEIVRTWLYYTILRVYQLTGKPAFKYVWISGLVMDAKGRKMSKSLGNIVYPKPLIEKYGADALRLFGACEAMLGSDIRFSKKKVEGMAKFIQKLYSIARFVSMFPEPSKDEIELIMTDNWILAETNRVIEIVKKHYDQLDFFGANFVKTFAWEVFADHYIELVKSRANGVIGDEKKQKAAWWTLHSVLKTILKLLAPVTPFITDYIYRELYGKTIHLEKFPSPEKYDPSLLKYTKLIMEVNSLIWKAKREKGLSLKSPIRKVYIPKDLQGFEMDLKGMHKIKEIIYGEIGDDALILEGTRVKIGIVF